MSRVLHVRVFEMAPDDREALQQRFADLAATRSWRDTIPWLADSGSPDLFSMEYFRHATRDCEERNPDFGTLCAATFVRLGGDETDALALLFILRDISEQFGVRVLLHDAENPIAKLRHIEMKDGRLPDGAPLENVLVRRSVFKKLPDGFRIEMYPPHALDSAFGSAETNGDRERRDWAFLVHGMRGSAPTFFEAEAEAMRIYNGLRRLE